MGKNLLFGSLQITIADGQFILQWELDKERSVSLWIYICIHKIDFKT